MGLLPPMIFYRLAVLTVLVHLHHDATDAWLLGSQFADYASALFIAILSDDRKPE